MTVTYFVFQDDGIVGLQQFFGMLEMSELQKDISLTIIKAFYVRIHTAPESSIA